MSDINFMSSSSIVDTEKAIEANLKLLHALWADGIKNQHDSN